MEKESYYDSENKNSWLKGLFIVLFAILIMFAIFFIIKILSGGKIENNLLKAGKDYYKKEDNLLPEAAGECNIVTLDQLMVNDYVKNEKIFTSCDSESTYVKVCKLESGKYHYTPVIQCGTKEDTKFGDWKVGTEKDLVEDKSDVKFTFMPKMFSNKAKEYYPSKKTSATEVSELYASAPNAEYTYKDEGVTATKWYTEANGKSYWGNGQYSSTQPSGYANRGNEGPSVTSTSATRPTEAEYRTISEITLYRTTTSSKPYVLSYSCIDRNYKGSITSTTPCEQRTENNYNITLGTYYTCDGKTSISKNATCTATPTSDWTTTSCTNSETIGCETKAGYQYTDRRWQWYTTGSYRKYYPSGASSAAGETTYYVNAPIAGAKSDGPTATTVYKFYKLIEDSNSTSTNEYVNLSDKYVEATEMIEIFKKNNFEVETLKDILNNEKIKYSIKLEYSNRE
ncbi:MAG TPA: hypothetical protein PLV83_03920 [Bacilli bacterium]|nr:hypothetical protein [Bacilli bacterium]